MGDYVADVLVIGSGAAGIRAAMAASDEGAKVMLLTRKRLCESGSSFYPFTPGWGLSAARMESGFSDSPDAHFQDIIHSAQGMCSPRLARVLSEEAPRRLAELVELGIRVSRLNESHCFNRHPRSVLAHDMRNIKDVLGNAVKQRPIDILENCRVISLAIENGGCVGAECIKSDSNVRFYITARATVLATGGGGGLFKYSLTTHDVTGDGYGLALRAGAWVTNMEFIQIAFGMVAPIWACLFTEQLFRYEPRLVNSEGKALTELYFEESEYRDYCRLRMTHAPYTSLCPSGEIDRAVFSEISAGRGTKNGGLIADFSHVDPSEFTVGDLGEWFAWMRHIGIDFGRQQIEIAPFVQAFNGGVIIDEHCRTTVPGLFACGEVAAGPHGADRLGGNMMIGNMVFGTRAGLAASQFALSGQRDVTSYAFDQVEGDVLKVSPVIGLKQLKDVTPGVTGVNVHDQILVEELKEKMSEHCSVVRTSEGLSEAIAYVESLQGTAGRYANRLLVSQVILEAALLRQESRGGHYRPEYPVCNEQFGAPISARLDQESEVIVYSRAYLR